MASEINAMLSEGTIEEYPVRMGFFTYPFMILKINGNSHFIMNLKSLNQFIICTQFKMTTTKQIREGIQPG